MGGLFCGACRFGVPQSSPIDGNEPFERRGRTVKPGDTSILSEKNHKKPPLFVQRET